MWRKNSWYLGVIFLILLSSCVYASSVRINEIMYNPSSEFGGTYNEWIELYNPTENIINLTNWKIADPSNHDLEILTEAILEPKGYFILAKKPEEFSLYYKIICPIAKVAFSLSNGGEEILLKDFSGQIIDSLIYSDTWGADGNGKTLEFYDGNWYESLNLGGTPGLENNQSSNQTETNNCDWGVGIISDNIFNNTKEFEFTIRVYNFHENKIKTNIIYLRKIEDVYGDIVKDYSNLTCEATYDKNCKTNWPNLAHGTYLIKSEIFPDCNDTDLGNNFHEKLIVILPEELGQDYSKLEINELFPDPQGYDTSAMPKGEWVELYNSGDESLDLENLSLKDNYGQDYDIFISDSNTIDGTIINPQNYLIIYMNGRYGFLNNDGFEKISLYKDDFLLDEVSYSGSIEGLTWGKINDIWKLTLPTPNSDNFYNESINKSKLEIENIYQEKIKFGDMVRVKIHVYKGNTNKYSIQAWIEDEDDNVISKRSRVSLYRKFTDYDLIIPIQIFSNCDEGYNEGEYEVIIEGLGLRDEKDIKIKGSDDSTCKIIEKETIKEVSTSITGLSEKDINAEYSVEYTSKEVKERRLAIYFFCIILTVMLIYFGLSKND